MNSIRNIIRNIISTITSTLFTTTTPCETINEFFYICGHTVTTRRCHNPALPGTHAAYYLPEDGCHATCRTPRVLPTITHFYIDCPWCGAYPNVPITPAIRSDPGVNVIPHDELLRRRKAHRNEYSRRMTESAQARFRHMASRRAQWEVVRRAEHEAQDAWVLDYGERTFFVGGGIDTRLMWPIPLHEIPEGPEGLCSICRESLREGTAVVLPCHEAHTAHSDCFENWFFHDVDTNHCPYCRMPFRLQRFEEWCEAFVEYGGFFSDVPVVVEEEEG